MLRATVAPTLPAPPTTVTLRFISRLLKFFSMPSTVSQSKQNELGQVTSRRKKFYTESVENPVEKIAENRIALQQSEEISRLHYRGAMHSRAKHHPVLSDVEG
jgi:hypothetical protein